MATDARSEPTVRKPKRRLRQYSISSLLLLTLACAVGLALVAVPAERRRRPATVGFCAAVISTDSALASESQPPREQLASARPVPPDRLRAKPRAPADSGSTLKQRRDQALAPLPTAHDIVYSEDGPGQFSVSYTLEERFPAKKSLRLLAHRLRSKGWHPLQEDWLNPGIPSSHVRGWVGIETDNISNTENQWNGQWADERGNVVAYFLSCSGSSRAAANSSIISVHALWTDALQVSQLQHGIDSVRNASVVGRLACMAFVALVLFTCFAAVCYRFVFRRFRRSPVA